MADESRFDEIIEFHSRKQFPEFYLFQGAHAGAPLHLLFKAQISAESSFKANAVSPCGALGLMQLMPATAQEVARGESAMARAKMNLFDPRICIDLGIRYDRLQYERFPEIPDKDERLKFMLASYNCGRGYINAALEMARREEFGFRPLATVPGKWQTWRFSSQMLNRDDCMVNGRRPDFKQVWEYVEKIWAKYRRYALGAGLTGSTPEGVPPRRA